MSIYKITSIDEDAEGATIALPLGSAPPPVLDLSTPQPPATSAPPPVPDAATSTTGVHGPGSAAASSDPGAGAPHTFIQSAAQARIGGRYEILRLVGVGGMGSVYEARDVELDEVVALKTLRRELLADQDMLERFKNEVKLARRVTHKNVARMFDIGEHQGEKFLTMEFVDGESLATMLEREAHTRRLPLSRVIEIISAVCAGLTAAHSAGVIHRDLKPDNVMLAKDGRVLVTDFGIARATLATGDRTVGMVLGTPAYMAPEQVQGMKDIDSRVDIYALGAMLYELFTGEDAWAGESPMHIATARLLHPPPDPRVRRRDLPEAAARVVLRCMATRREDRYATTDMIAAELAALTLPSAIAPSTSSLSPLSSALSSSSPTPTLATPTAVLQRSAPEPTKTEKSVAVLPFRNAGAPADEYLADGLTDDLIDALSMTRGLRVCSRGAVTKFRGASADAREIGGELGVQVVVEGSVRKMPGAVRINARLISVADGFQLWAKRFDRPDTDLFTINDEAARAIAEALTVDPTAPAREAPSDPVAIDLYLRARTEYHKIFPENVARSVDLFQQALARAPNDPTILSGYATAMTRLSFQSGGDTELPMQAAERAVAAAPNLPEAHLALAIVRLQSGDPAGAIRSAKVALKGGPALAEAHWLLGRILSEANYVGEGVRRLQLAKSLDPALHIALRDLARVHALLGDWAAYDRLIDELAKATGDSGIWLDRARTLLWRGDIELAKRYANEFTLPADRLPFVRVALRVVLNPDQSPFADGSMDRFLLISKGPSRRQSFFQQIEAEIAAYVGDEARALDAITRSVSSGLIDLLWLLRCPVFEKLRAHPTFLAQRGLLEERARQIVEAYIST